MDATKLRTEHDIVKCPRHDVGYFRGEVCGECNPELAKTFREKRGVAFFGHKPPTPSPVEQLAPVQEAVNEMQNQIVDNAERSVPPRFFTKDEVMGEHD